MHDEHHPEHEFQRWGKTTKKFAKLRQDYTGEVTIKHVYVDGILRSAKVVGAEWPITIKKLDYKRRN